MSHDRFGAAKPPRDDILLGGSSGASPEVYLDADYTDDRNAIAARRPVQAKKGGLKYYGHTKKTQGLIDA